ncbi:septum site-determining protein MinC [Silvimonas terrae]|uniref:Probable septum site-determining protein MinC n=1 Tax=Silvimonas terrae TaxID=300266 RepID=A0A840RC94_9NEIS|nr:septum site-determining protein MinC [Silvimonas terrae]MBB5190013.1 septum site-determining protein MinC [Silvimonas terrae]
MSRSRTEASAFEFKNIGLKLLTFVPATTDITELETGLQAKLGGRDHMLTGDQLAIDFNQLPQTPTALDISAMITLLRQFGLQPVGAYGGNEAQQTAAREAGLVVLSDDAISLPVAAPAAAPVQVERTPTMVITRPVRTGQQVYAKDADLVVMALVSNGAEVIADGNIHVYAPLRGRALAGARGDANARIFTTCMEAELVSIAGVYRTLDESLPASLKSKPAQVLLNEDKLVIETLTLS